MDEFPIKRSFIEEAIPVKEVSEESAREKNIRHGQHKVLLLWEKGWRDEITETLQETSWLKDSFFRFAQAVSLCLPNDKLLDGFLTGKERTISEAKARDAKLTDFFE